MSLEYAGGRSVKKKLVLFCMAVGLIVAIAAGAIAVNKYMPTREQADLGQVFEVTGEETRIYYNQEKLDLLAITRDGQAYLPLEWVNDNLNEKFYWDQVEKVLVYTLPDTIVYADKRTLGSEGKPLLLEEDGEIYLSVALVNTYTDIHVNSFVGGEYKRIFIDDTLDAWQMGTAAKATSVRVKGGIKSPVLTKLEKGHQFWVLEQLTEWSKVRTEDGFVGYLPNKAIAGIETKQRPQVFVEPEYSSLSLGEEVCLVWHQVLDETANSTMQQKIAATKGVNVIAPTWFMLTDNEGSFHSYADKAYVDQAHALGMQVWAVLDNFNMGENVDSGVLFAKTSVRKSLISNLMDEVAAYGIDGINLDIEGIKPSAGPQYVQFIRELSVACRNAGIILSVDNYVPSAYTSFYNRAEQGRVVDYVIIMAYDEHYAGGEAGSVASLPYVEQGIIDTLAEVPKEKVINAVPFYTRVWTQKEEATTSKAYGIAEAKKWISENQVQLYWQEELGQYYGEINTTEGYKAIWMEEEASLERKMALIEEYDLAGVACWKLGIESASVWDVVSGNKVVE